MISFRKNIIGQIDQIGVGKIFTFKDLSFETKRVANVAVILSELCREGRVKRHSKGAYYRPRRSKLGLGEIPVFQDEQLRYLTDKFNGYITGPYVFNKMGLTDQVATTITIATPSPVRSVNLTNISVTFQKAYYVGHPSQKTIPYLQLLDAIKELKHIPGNSEQNTYDKIKNLYFSKFRLPELEKIATLSESYPPRVRRVVADLLHDINQPALQTKIENTLHPTTHFNFNYK